MIGLKPESIAVIRYSPTGTLGKVYRAGFVGYRLAFDAGADVHERHVDTGKHGPGRVLNDAGNLCRVELCLRGRRRRAR